MSQTTVVSVNAALDEPTLKREIELACRILGVNGHGDNVLGHVAGRLAGSDRFWMKGAGVGLEETAQRDLVLLDLDGNVRAGDRQPHEEYPIHAEVMRARPEVLAVVHTHPKFSIAFAARGLELRPVSHEGSYFWPPGVPTFTEFTDLARTRAQGEAVARALGDAKALFLLSHGIVVCATSVVEVTWAALMLERAAELQLLAQLTRDAPLRHTSADEAVRKRAIFNPERTRAVFDYYVRKLGG